MTSQAVLLACGTNLPTDPFFSSVVVLAINDSAANGSTTFIDQSSYARAITTVGDTKYSSAQFPTGLSTSGLWDGTGDTLTFVASPTLAPGANPFTIEAFVRYNGTAGTRVIVDGRTGGGGGALLYSNGVNLLGLAHAITCTGTLPTNATWTHVAFTRDGSSNYQLWVAGAASGSSQNDAVALTDQNLRIGESNDGSSSFIGNIAAVRITNGVCRYTGAFTPPTLPFPNQ